MLNQDQCASKNDNELVKLTLKNQEFFSCLVKKYEAPLMRYVLRISNVSQDDAEDVLQDVFIKVYKNLNDFDPKLKFSSWIYRITHNEVISNWRKLKSQPQAVFSEVSERVIENLSTELNLDKIIDDDYLSKTVSVVLDKIDLKYREVITLKFFEDKSYAEMSDILKKPQGTIATLLNRAKKEFIKEIKKNNIKIN